MDEENSEQPFEPFPDAETDNVLFYPDIPACAQLRRRWYMRRKTRPMVPAPSNTPMPDKQSNAEAKARLYSVYLRPWTLHNDAATPEVPHITNLDDLTACRATSEATAGAAAAHSGGSTLERSTEADAEHRRKRLRGKQKPNESEPSIRSFASAWSWYVRGHIVSEHAARIIKQFMAACCGKASKDADEFDGDDDGRQRCREMQDNTLPLARVHAILD